MSYFKVLGLTKEPFSTSPDPFFFYPSLSHETALKRLEISIRLRRGLSLILGDIGIGKTTLSRALLNTFKEEENFLFHMMLDADYESEFDFLQKLVNIFGITPRSKTSTAFKESIEQYLFHKGVEENKTVILLIDEGQKMRRHTLEALRMLLNYETNEFKLLQLVIMAQLELIPRIKEIHNFIDRLSLQYIINPLDETETEELIHFRLRQAGCEKPDSIFSKEAVKSVFKYTQGFPRKIAMLCHYALETIVMKGLEKVDFEIIAGLIYEEQTHKKYYFPEKHSTHG